MIGPAAATELVRTEWSEFIDAVEAAGPDVWDVPTRLPGWTVEDLARHVHWGISLEADALARAQDGGDGPAAGTELTGPREQIVPSLRTAASSLVQRLGQLGEPMSGTAPMPYGDLPMALAVSIFVMEAAVHRSDLAAAVRAAHAPGHEEGAPRGGLAPAAHSSCAFVLQTFWPVLAQSATSTPAAGTTIRLRGPQVLVEAGYDGAGWGAPQGEPTVVIEGSDDAVLLYAYGRLPFDEADLTVTGDSDLAARFKQLVPGP